MKKRNIVFVFALFSIFLTAALMANSKKASFNGQTGLIATPNAKIGWEEPKIGIDAGFHYIHDDDYSIIPSASLSLFRMWEIGFGADVQENRGNDFLLHSKFNFFPQGKTALAVGVNFQWIRFQEGADTEFFGQVYVAVTYDGSFFSWPAETSIVLGKTFHEDNDSNIDFSMGFDLDVFPKYLKHHLRWINEFSNYSYSVQPTGSDHRNRGVFNTGLRGILPMPSGFKLSIDLVCTDVLDEGSRSFAIGMTAGMSF